MKRPAPAELLRPGDLLVAGQTLGEPSAVLEELFSSPLPPGVRCFAGMSLTDVFSRAPAGVGLETFVGLGTNGPLVGSGRMQLVPCHMSDLTRTLSPDVAVVALSPPDADGRCSLGMGADYIADAVARARVVIAEVNEQIPVVAGDTAVAWERVDAAVRTNRPLPEMSPAVSTGEERAIAAHVATLVGDGACVQVGVGRLGEAVLQAVADRRDLGVHAGMVGDTILEMARAGVVTGACKEVDRGLIVAGSVLGTAKAVHLAAGEPRLRLRSIAHTHAPDVIAALGRFVCVNSAIEVDLLGQVNAEMAAGRAVGTIGGAVDFLRGAARSAGGRSVVALPSTAKHGQVSRVVPVVERVTALRADVDAVATEHGIADLRGATEGTRAELLIALAAPEHRDRLRAAARTMGL